MNLIKPGSSGGYSLMTSCSVEVEICWWRW